MSRRVTVVAAGHLAGCPRMLKAADALHWAGYDVRVVSGLYMEELARVDASLAASRGWRWRPVAHGRRRAPVTWLRAGVRRRLARVAAARWRSPMPAGLAAAAYARAHGELVRAILESPADLVYGGTGGALLAVAEAGRRMGAAWAVDFEDLHYAEQDDPAHALDDRLGRQAMVGGAAGAAFVTAGSAAMAAACRTDLGIDAIPIHNVFALPARPPEMHPARPRLALYWFSQTIGPGRGLEMAVRAAGLADRPMSLHLRGGAVAGYLDHLRALAGAEAPQLRVDVLDLAPPEAMVDECRRFDVGLSLEQGHIRNKEVCLPNKAPTYILAGLPVALTDTAGQAPLAADLGPGAVRCAPGDAAALADGLVRLAADGAVFRRAREASWAAARTRWHWEHELERGALLGAVEAATR